MPIAIMSDPSLEIEIEEFLHANLGNNVGSYESDHSNGDELHNLEMIVIDSRRATSRSPSHSPRDWGGASAHALPNNFDDLDLDLEELSELDLMV